MMDSNRLQRLKEQLLADSASWGSLLILALSVAMLVFFMVLYSYE
jgi:hypothetical protein